MNLLPVELPWTISSLPSELLCWRQDKTDSRLPSFLVVYVAYRPDRLWQDSDHYCQGFRTSLACFACLLLACFLWQFLCFHQFSFLFGARCRKLHITKPVSISFQLQISPATISLLFSRRHAEIDTIVRPNCIQKCSRCFISEHSCSVEFLYFFIC